MPSEYRIEGLISVEIWDDSDPTRVEYVIFEEEYDDDDIRPRMEETLNRYVICHRPRLTHYLKIIRGLKGYDLPYDTMIDMIHNFGGININPNNGGWKSYSVLIY